MNEIAYTEETGARRTQGPADNMQVVFDQQNRIANALHTMNQQQAQVIQKIQGKRVLTFFLGLASGVTASVVVCLVITWILGIW